MMFDFKIRSFSLSCFDSTLLLCLHLCCIQAKSKASNGGGEKEAENSARLDNTPCFITTTLYEQERPWTETFFSPMM